MSTLTDYKKPSSGKLVLFLFLSFFAGGVAICLLVYLYWINMFTDWRFISQAPANSAEIVGADQDAVYVRSADNTVYACSLSNKDPVCTPVEGKSFTPPEPCDYKNTAFSPLKKPQKTIRSCMEIQGAMAETGYVQIYALDQDGKLWEWYTGHHALEIVAAPFVIVAGSLAAGLFGSVVWVVWRFARRKGMPAGELFPKPQLILLAVPWVCLLLSIIGMYLLLRPPR